MKNQTIRSFIAIPLPRPVQQSIDEYLDGLKRRQKSGVRWVNAAKIHITMKFLGDIPPSRSLTSTRLCRQQQRPAPPSPWT